ncbi:MAG: hypothetical protein AB8B79_05850 [Granulosicoccus sp.]
MAIDKQDRCNFSRRSCIGAILAAALQPLSSSAHTPYKQWAVYRQKHLLVGCHKDDPETYELSKEIVALLETELPTASARVARAPAATRLASLLATDQLNVAVIAPETAAAMQSGAGIFAAYGSIPLGTLLPIGSKVLVGHHRLHDNHSWQITKALEPMSTVDVKTVSPSLPWHKGSLQYVLGKPKPNKH